MLGELLQGVDLAQWDKLLGITAACISIIVGSVKLKRVIYLRVYLGCKRKLLEYFAKRERRQIEELFRKMRPMLEIELQSTLQGYHKILHEQQITIASSVAEGVEFKNFITESISVLQSTMAQVVTTAEHNAKDADIIKRQLAQQGYDLPITELVADVSED